MPKIIELTVEFEVQRMIDVLFHRNVYFWCQPVLCKLRFKQRRMQAEGHGCHVPPPWAASLVTHSTTNVIWKPFVADFRIHLLSPSLADFVLVLHEGVSCPGVWLCQDGRVSLTVFALGTSYQTCLLPPLFPLMFKDVFYFRKRFQETCALNNICCLLKDETIYCELVQWSEDCMAGECVILAQYLGALNDVLFPPNMCSNDGVDLLMRRSKDFPGILSPKIEIGTKVRIDEVWNQPCSAVPKPVTCRCGSKDDARQKQVCHTAKYHRNKCNTSKRPQSRSGSRSRSGGSRSCCSLNVVEPEPVICKCPNPVTKSRASLLRSPRGSARRSRKCREYSVYSVHTQQDVPWRQRDTSHARDGSGCDDVPRYNHETEKMDETPFPDRLQKIILESRYIDNEGYVHKPREGLSKVNRGKITPCICEICRRYHELFHRDSNSNS